MKALVIGLDAATFDIIGPLVAQGRLPILADLISRGVHGPLRSTIIPNTFPGWTSCTAGVNEGKHGIFIHLRKIKKEPKFVPISAFDVRVKRVWNLLSERGMHSIVVNMPLTYPVSPLNGVLLSGMLTPSIDSTWTYPNSLKDEILSIYGSYTIDVSKMLARDVFRVEAQKCIDLRAKVFKYLLSRYPWDFAIVNFSTLDRVQHEFWADMDSSHHLHSPHESQKFGRVIEETYEHLDRIIGEVLAEIPESTLVMVVSDHGAGPDHDAVFVNTWLMRHSLLRPANGLNLRLRSSLDSVRTMKNGYVGRKVFSAYRWLRSRVHDMTKSEAGMASGSRMDFAHQIDWTKTVAYFGPDRGGVWINLKGREKYGIVSEGDYDRVRDEVSEVLLSWRFPKTGEPVFSRILKREEAFNGPYLELMPDLVPVPARDSISPVAKINPSTEFMKPTWCSGAHSTYGIFIATGPGIRQGIKLRGAELKDIAPTVLYALGLPLTEEMDGKVLLDIFTDEFKSTHTIKREGSSYFEINDMRGLSEEESALIEERLKGLGYIA